jgi:hypothetical protein
MRKKRFPPRAPGTERKRLPAVCNFNDNLNGWIFQEAQMGSSFVLRVELTFPSPAVAKTFSTRILTEPSRKLKDPFSGELPERSVADALAEWKNMGDALVLSVRSKNWLLTGLVGEDAFNDMAPELAALVLTGGQAGAAGEALACGVEFEDGYRLTFAEKEGLKIKRLLMSEATEIQRQSWFRKVFLTK